MNSKTKAIQEFLGIKIYLDRVQYEVLEVERSDYYHRQLIRYRGSEDDEIRAFLFLPEIAMPVGGILVHHQHHGERHLGKSEVAGIAGDPLQAFCPALARQGIITLAPDSICFEDRRRNMTGIMPAFDSEDDHLQHYNEMCYRLLKGELLMKKVIEDSSIGISLLEGVQGISADRIGILGHSYGGNTVLFHSPFDERIQFSCSSGAACSYRNKLDNETGIELAEVIPGFYKEYDIDDLVKGIAPRKLLLLSGTNDKYSRDAGDLFEGAKKVYSEYGCESNIFWQDYKGGHAITEERFDFIVNWFKKEFKRTK
ncbi:MAG: hypothetical protein KDC80_25860 [Saprospiraceae bacterium]|nr:hypothetical protein [Saprospiraceae bacterium]